MLQAEVDQCIDEGVKIPKYLRDAISHLDPIRDAWNTPIIDDLMATLSDLPRDPFLSESEPSDLQSIRKLTKKIAVKESTTQIVGDLAIRIEAAWRGRLVGCALGLPYERIGCEVIDGRNVGTARVQHHLRATANYPITDFAKALPDPNIAWGVHSLSDSISEMEPDDDIHFTIANLCIFEQHGKDFQWFDVADWWISNLPLTEFCTAEVQALLTYANSTARWGSDGGARSNAQMERTRAFQNPYREWIGAQIRSDFWGWVSPLNPYQASEFAYRDAGWTHERNGIYSAMFFSALQALAFGHDNRASLIEQALSYIPAGSRLSMAINWALEISESDNEWEDALALLLSTINTNRERDLSPVHSINNSAICVLALLRGQTNPLDAIKLAVMSGHDTDCNGATVGAISGVLFGDELSKDVLTRKMGDGIRTRIGASPRLHVPDLVERTIATIS